MIFLIIVALIIACDQILKLTVEKFVPEGEKYELIKDKVCITNVRNKGIALGMLKNNQKLVLVLSFIAIFIFSLSYFLIIKRGRKSLTYTVAFAFAIGCAISNIIDRFRNNYVTDFISIKTTKRTPAFNLADIFVVVGILAFSIKEFKDNFKI